MGSHSFLFFREPCFIIIFLNPLKEYSLLLTTFARGLRPRTGIAGDSGLPAYFAAVSGNE